MPLPKDSHTLPAAQSWLQKQYLLVSVIAPFALFFALITAVELIAKQQQLHEQSLLHNNLAEKTNEVRTLLEYELNSTLHLATGLVSYIQSKQGVLIPQEIDPWLANLQGRAQYIRNIGVAPGNRITYVYPLKGNEAALGLYYPDNKEQWPAVQAIITNRQPMLAGPIHLQQGGLGLIYRVPVFLNHEVYWGLVSTVLNFDAIYSSIHNRAQQLGIKIAIKDRDQQGQILFGDADVIANNELNLSVPGRNWQMVSSQYESPKAPSLINTIRVGGWLITLAISLLFNSFLRSLAQQNQTLRELDESKYRFSQAFKSAPQGILLITHTGTLIDFNESLCNSLGYSRAELNQQNFFTLATNNQRVRLMNIVEGIYPKPGDNHQYETTLLHKNGHPINVIISLAPTHTNIYESDWIVQIIDISHRVAFEQLLQEEASYNQSILHSVIDAIMTLDVNGNIRSVNPAASRIFGYAEDQFIHHHINHFVQDPVSGSIMRHIKYHSEGSDINAGISRDLIGLKLDGEVFPIELQLSCIQRKQERLFIAVIRDISERKRLDKLKHEFITTISHELRTPLTAILGSLKLMDSGTFGSFSEPVQNMVRIANQNGQKLVMLVNDLLDMDKLLAGKMQFDFKVQAIYPMIVEAIENISAYAAQHEVTINLVSEDEQLHVNVDQQRLQQVLTNLLSNAAKFSPPHSSIEVKIFSRDNNLRIEVIDHGVGISHEAQAKLFQKFYQADNSNTRKTSGTGLGLAISKELINAMHGTIGVNSETDQGSCFYIELPSVKYRAILE